MKRLLFIICVLFNFTACTHVLSVPSISSNQMLFETTELKTKTACIVITPEFKNYQFTKKAYNWAGGSLFPDTIIFDLGNTLTSEINGLCRALFNRTVQIKVDPFVKTKNSIFKVTVLSLCFSCFYQNIPLPVSYYQETDVVFPGYKSSYSY